MGDNLNNSEPTIKPIQTHVLSTEVETDDKDEGGNKKVKTLEINAILEAGKFYKVDDNTKGDELGDYDGSEATFLYDNKEWTVTAVQESEGGRRRSRKSNKKSKKSKGGKKSSRKSRKSRRSRKSRK